MLRCPNGLRCEGSLDLPVRDVSQFATVRWGDAGGFIAGWRVRADDIGDYLSWVVVRADDICEYRASSSRSRVRRLTVEEYRELSVLACFGAAYPGFHPALRLWARWAGVSWPQRSVAPPGSCIAVVWPQRSGVLPGSGERAYVASTE